MRPDLRPPGLYQSMIDEQVTKLQRHFAKGDDLLTYRPSYIEEVTGVFPIWAEPFDAKRLRPDQKNRFINYIEDPVFLANWLPRDNSRQKRVIVEREMITSPNYGDNVLIERVILENNTGKKVRQYTGILFNGREEDSTLRGQEQGLFMVDCSWDPATPWYYVVRLATVRDHLQNPYPMLYKNAVRVPSLE